MILRLQENETPLISWKVLAEHMANVVAILVGESNVALIRDPLDTASNMLEKFMVESSVPIFAVDRTVQRDDATDETSVVYTALIEMQYRKDRTMTVIFAKKGQVITADAPIQDQLLVTQ